MRHSRFRVVLCVALLSILSFGAVLAACDSSELDAKEVSCNRDCAAFVTWTVATQANAFLHHLAELWFAGVVARSPHSMCVKAHESDSAGGYRAVNPSGRYRGAGQWDRDTWAKASTRAGYSEWSTTPTDQVPWYVQELVFAVWASIYGDAPWGHRCD